MQLQLKGHFYNIAIRRAFCAEQNVGWQTTRSQSTLGRDTNAREDAHEVDGVQAAHQVVIFKGRVL